MLQLHAHNRTTYLNLTKLFRTHNRAAVVQPTGTGKSFIVLKLIEDNKGSRFLVVSPSIYIFSQFGKHAESSDVSLKNVDFITYSKLATLEKIKIESFKYDYIVLDEFHRCGALEWGKGVNTLLSCLPNAKVLGTSATPIRYLDSGRNMAEELFGGVYAVNMSLAAAINLGILPLPIYVTGLYSFSGEIEKLRLRAEKTKNPKLKKILLGKIKKAKGLINKTDCGIEKIFEKHLPDNCGKYIVFCPNVQKLGDIMQECNAWFVNQNIHKYKVYSDNANSDKEFEAFCEDKDPNSLKLLFCVDMLNEGVHIDDVNGVIMLRSTESANVFYQQLGRALACSMRNRKPVIFDIVNNFEVGDTAKAYSEIMELSRENGYRSDDDIQFEIYDYVRDIREIISEIQSSMANSWQYNFELVKTFVEENERFPLTSEAADNVRIGQWCLVQRNLHKENKLNTERAKKLEDIGFAWNLGDENWNNNFNAVKSYYEKYGKFPQSDSDDSVKILYKWLISQRAAYRKGKLTEERTAKLQGIGFSLESVSKADKWEDNYKELCDYVDKHGSLPTVGSGDLYNWMRRQVTRYTHGKITAEQKEKLDNIGFVWDANFRQWKNQFALLQSFIAENGRIPNCKEKYDGCSIGQWYLRQIKELNSGNLSEEKSEMFKNLDVKLVNSTEARITENWLYNYELLKNFIQNNNRFPKHSDKVDGISPYDWFMKQKEYYKLGKLQAWQIEKINALGTDIAVFLTQKRELSEQWQDSYNSYLLFVTENHRKPKGSVEDEAKLNRWENKQRQRYKDGTLSMAQQELLIKAGII